MIAPAKLDLTPAKFEVKGAKLVFPPAKLVVRHAKLNVRPATLTVAHAELTVAAAMRVALRAKPRFRPAILGDGSWIPAALPLSRLSCPLRFPYLPRFRVCIRQKKCSAEHYE